MPAVTKAENITLKYLQLINKNFDDKYWKKKLYNNIVKQINFKESIPTDIMWKVKIFSKILF